MIQGIYEPQRPAQLSVVYSHQHRAKYATLQVGANNAATLAITAMRESVTGSLLAYDLDGDSRFTTEVSDHESLTFIVRNEGTIIACGVFEVNFALAESIGVLLVPCTVHNLLVDQCEGELIRRAVNTALDRVATTGALAAQEVR